MNLSYICVACASFSRQLLESELDSRSNRMNGENKCGQNFLLMIELLTALSPITPLNVVN